jgi:hypothetical protein
VYIDTGSSMPISPSTSRDLADEITKFDGMEMIRASSKENDLPLCIYF